MGPEAFMIARRLAILLASVALHIGGVGLVLMAFGVDPGRVIVVDLESPVAGDPRPAPRPDAASRLVSPPAGAISPVLAPRFPRVGGRDRASGPGAPAAAPIPDGQGTAEERPTPGAASPGAPRPPLTVTHVPVAPPPVAPALESGRPPEDGTAASGHGTPPDGVASTLAEAPRPGAAGPARGSRSGSPTGVGDGGVPAALAAAGEGRGGVPPEYAPYLERFRRRVAESMRYPLAARRQGLTGRVELEVLLEPSGRVTEARVIVSSSHAVLDEAALDAVKGLSAEPFPERLPRRPLRIHLPLAFELE